MDKITRRKTNSFFAVRTGLNALKSSSFNVSETPIRSWNPFMPLITHPPNIYCPISKWNAVGGVCTILWRVPFTDKFGEERRNTVEIAYSMPWTIWTSLPFFAFTSWWCSTRNFCLPLMTLFADPPNNCVSFGSEVSRCQRCVLSWMPFPCNFRKKFLERVLRKGRWKVG